MPFQSWINPWTKPISDDGYRFSPLHLGPYAFYDANLGGSSTGITDSSAYARADMTVGAGSNSPLWLPYSTPAVYLTRASGNFVYTLKSVTLATNQTLEFVHRYSGLSLDATPQCIGTFRSGTGVGVMLYATNAGVRPFAGDGTNSFDSAAYNGGALPAAGWVRVRFTPGAATTLTTETAADQETEPTSGWSTHATYTAGAGTGWAATSLTAYTGVSFTGTFPANIFSRQFICRVADTIVANFNASLCGQTGYTDSLGSVWTVTRATTGRKVVVQSPAANSANSLFLLGTDDWLDVPAAAIPPMTASDAFTWVAVARLWNTLPTNTDVVSKHQGYSGNLFPGVGLGMRSANNAGIRLKDGTNGNAPEATGVTSGIRQVIAGVVPASGTVVSYRNSSTASTARTVGDMTNAVNAYVGRNDSGVYIDMEFRSLLTFNRALSATEIAQLVAYYGGGL